MNTLLHAMWTVRDLPQREKRAWQQVFEYYVFGPFGPTRCAPAGGGPWCLGPFDESARRIARPVDQQAQSLSPRGRAHRGRRSDRYGL